MKLSGKVSILLSIMLVACGGSGPEERTYVSEEGGFTVQMPGPFTVQTEHGEFSGNAASLHVAVAGDLETLEFRVAYYVFDHPKGPIDAALSFGRQLEALKNGSALSSDPEFEFVSGQQLNKYGYPALDFEMKHGDDHLWQRQVIKGERLYVLQGSASESSQRAAYDKLVETFRFDEAT